MKKIHYPNTIRSHWSQSYQLRRLLQNPSLILLNPNNHYNHGFHNTFDYNHHVYSDYLVCRSVPTIAQIIRY